MELVKKTIEHTVESDKDQLLTIIIGEGQKGYNSFRNVDGKYYNGQIVHDNLGKGTDLKGNYIKVNTTVTDVNPDTNNTSISFYFNNKLIHDESLFDSEAEEDQGTVFYKTTINFK